MSKHTPGPWKACKPHEDYDGPLYELDEDDEERMAKVLYNHIEHSEGYITSAHDCFRFRNPDDAFLIAAAPDMYDMLHAMVNGWSVQYGSIDDECLDCGWVWEDPEGGKYIAECFLGDIPVWPESAREALARQLS